MILNTLLISIIALYIPHTPITNDGIDKIGKVIDVAFDRYTDITPEAEANPDSTYIHYALIKIDVANNQQIQSIVTSDGSSKWLSAQLRKMLLKKELLITPLNTIIRQNKIRQSTLVFPIIFGTIGFRSLTFNLPATPTNFYTFNGKHLSGKILFGSMIEIGKHYNIIAKKNDTTYP